MNRDDYIENLTDFMAQMPLESIFYARFDNTEGPKIDYQYPRSFPLKEMMPKLLFSQIYGKVMTVKTHTVRNDGETVHYKIVSCPDSIKNEVKYKDHRNQFLFNIGCVSNFLL